MAQLVQMCPEGHSGRGMMHIAWHSWVIVFFCCHYAKQCALCGDDDDSGGEAYGETNVCHNDEFGGEVKVVMMMVVVRPMAIMMMLVTMRMMILMIKAYNADGRGAKVLERRDLTHGRTWMINSKTHHPYLISRINHNPSARVYSAGSSDYKHLYIYQFVP